MGPDLEGLIEAKFRELQAGGAIPSSVGAPEPAWIQSLAMAIAQLTDQGTGQQRRLPPDILVAREKGRERMLELIMQAHANGDRPRYRLVTKVYLDEVLIDPKWIDRDHIVRDTEIEWSGVPSEAMRPVNPVAEEIWAQFNAWLGGVKMPELTLKVTPGGLTVIKTGAREQERQHVGGGEPSGGLRIMNRDVQPGQTPVTRVLGSVHPPAQHMP